MSTFPPEPPEPAAPPAAAPLYTSPPASPQVAAPPLTEPPTRRRVPVLGIVLGAVLLAVLGVLAYFVVMSIQTQQRLDEAERRIEEQQQRIEEQDETIQEQQEAVDAKDTFAKSAQALMDSARRFEGLPFATIVDMGQAQVDVENAWAARWNPARVVELAAGLDEQRANFDRIAEEAAARAGGNESGRIAEATIDQLGSGYVRSIFEDADGFCGGDVLACVPGEDPFSVHFDLVSDGQEAMTDWIRTGIAYHEFAHVLQFTNPEATDAAAPAFGGDWETMADCYALTVLPGWTLDHRVPIDAFSWWEISVGYGYTCDEPQRQVIRDWLGQVGFHLQPLTQ